VTNIWNDAVDQRLKELRKTLSQEATAERLSEEFGYNYTRNAVKNREGRIPEKVEERPNYKETVEILSDGSQKSDKRVKMSAEQSKDINFLLEAHGFDKDEWELVNAKNNIWNAYSKQDGIMQLYSSKITVKPKKNQTSLETILEAIKDITPIHIDTKPVETDNGLLEIPLFDTHFGISSYEHYKPTQNKIMNLLSKQWREVLFIIGQDLLHHDNFRSTTASGTAIEQVDFAKAWEDARKMYEPMIEQSIKCSKIVKVMYSKGNHDESMSWAFVQMLKSRFPQVHFDDAITERKAHTFGKVFIGITHGDKARRNLHNLFPVEFPLEWSQAKTRELHTGHYHKEDANDIYGMMVRTLATRNKTDQWHKDNGFVGAHKRFMVFEYSETELESIHYV
jgi:hypothetical protein